MAKDGVNDDGSVKATHTMTITMRPNGQMTVEGPFHNKMLCYGMLECARDVVAAHKIEDPSRILKPESVFRKM